MSDSEDSNISSDDLDFAQKRRSVRANRTRVDYSGFGDSRARNDDDDDDDSDDNRRPRKKQSKQDEFSSDEDGGSQQDLEPMMEIETLVARRNGDTNDPDSLEGPFDYLVKWKELSYLHVEWISEPDLIFLAGPRMKTKIKRFNQQWETRRFKQATLQSAEKELEGGEDDVTAKMEHWMTTGDLFDPALAEIEKILAVKTIPDALAPPPASLPEDISSSGIQPETSPSPTPEGTSAADSSASSGDNGQTTTSPQLEESDIVPNTTVTLGELRRLHDEFNFPPYRQAIHIREMKKLAKAPEDIKRKIADENKQHTQRSAKLQTELAMAEQQLNTTTDQASIDHFTSIVERVREDMQAEDADFGNIMQDLEAELARLDAVKPGDLKFAPRECYLVKWKGCSYKNTTWEWPEAIDDDMKIAMFRRIETPPSGVLPLADRPQQAAAQAAKKKKKQKLLAPVPQDDVDFEAKKRAELDLLRFRRAAETLPVLRVPEALMPYALQLEISGLAQKEDEIICVNGVRCTGKRTEEINKMIKETTTQVRVLRFLRRETGHELEIKFDTQKRMGFVMDEIKQNAEASVPQFSWAQKMAPKRKSTVEYSAWIKKFPIPDDFNRFSAPPDHVNPAVRSAVLAVFLAREALAPLTIEKWSVECNVPKEYLHQWLLKDVPNDENLQRNEQIFQLWVARCAQAFGCSPSVDLRTIEASLLAGNPQQIVLPEARDTDLFVDPNRAYAKGLLATAQNELLGTESRFEAEARRQEADFLAASSDDQQRLLQEEMLKSQQPDEQDDEDEELYQDPSGGPTVYTQQLRRIQQLQSGASRFIPYGPSNLPRFKNSNVLREYQLQGVNWLVSKWYEGKNCILADEMGLGKTVQVVAFLEHLRVKEQLRGPFLIIAPLSTMGHWRREFENWTDANVCFYYDTTGGAKGRELIRQYEWFYEKLGYRKDVCKFNILLTTYETFIGDVDELAKIPFLSVVVDEGHRLKNQGGKLLQELKRIRVKHRLLLSGTPLQNNLQELWSLLNFCEPEKFHTAEIFLRRHDNLRTVEDVKGLQQEIAPYMLRRVKEDVEKSIPPKEETIVDVEMTTLQKKYYRAIFERNREFLYKGCKGNNKPQLINVEIELRKCCNHPFLITGAREKEMEDLQQAFEYENSVLSGRERQRKWNQAQIERLIQSSGKLVLVDKLLAKLKAEGRKVLIFSQMVKMLDLLKEYFEMKGYQYERLDGSVQGNTRQAAIDRFSKPDSKSFVFLLSTRAGGVGINLTAADTAIIFDSDWNPQNDAQAQARCHRIGQEKPVTIYRLVTKNSYEETMLDRAAKKLGLEQAVLGSGTTGQSGRELKPEELERMLRLGAYHHLQPSAKDDEESANFMSQDIESLLRTRTRKIKVDGIRGTVSLELTHNTVGDSAEGSSASAQGTHKSSDGMDVDVNDPDFWTKMLPKEETAQSLLFKLGEHAGIAELKQNAEVKFKFVKRVRELVEEILRLRDQGEVIDYNRMDTTVALLVQMSALQGVFGRDTCDAAVKWRSALEASKERKSRVKARELKEGISALDEELKDSQKSGRRGRPPKQEKAPQHTDSDMHEGAEDGMVEVEEEEVESKSRPSKSSTSASYGFQACHGCYDSGGSDLFPCSGKCKRAFHPDCYKVGSSVFTKCDECQIGGKCAVCDVAGPEVKIGKPADSTFVKKCSRDDCGRFFHRNCLQKGIDPRLVTFNVKGGEPDDFICPAHKCFKCGRGEGPAAGPVSVQCIRCYKAFHLCCMNASHTKRASKNLIVCPDHLKGRTFPLSEHTKYGELTKRKALPRPGNGSAASVNIANASAKKVTLVDKKRPPIPTAGGSGPPKKLVMTTSSSSAGGAESTKKEKKVAPIVLKLKTTTT